MSNWNQWVSVILLALVAVFVVKYCLDRRKLKKELETFEPSQPTQRPE